MGLRIIRLKLYWLEMSHGSPAQSPVLQCLCSQSPFMSTVWGWGGMLNQKKKKCPTNAYIVLSLAGMKFCALPRFFIYKAHGSRDWQQI